MNIVSQKGKAKLVYWVENPKDARFLDSKLKKLSARVFVTGNRELGDMQRLIATRIDRKDCNEIIIRPYNCRIGKVEPPREMDYSGSLKKSALVIKDGKVKYAFVNIPPLSETDNLFPKNIRYPDCDFPA